jgi:hypothetical protein
MTDPARMIDQLLAMLAQLGWTPPTGGDVIELILSGELLTLDQAADVAECSDEKIRKACELAAMTNRPMGVKWAKRWLVGKARLLGDIENGKLDSRRGVDARRRAEERARKYEGWARPQGRSSAQHLAPVPPDRASPA